MTLKTLVLGLLVVLCVRPSYGQEGRSEDTYAFRYAEPGRTTIDVYVWGAVRRPGVWQIGPNVDLLEFLSVVQVPGVGQDEGSTQERTLLRIYRTNNGMRQSVYNERLDRIIAEGGSYPSLQDGDILEVVTRRRRRFGLQTVAQLITAASSLTLLIIRLSRGL